LSKEKDIKLIKALKKDVRGAYADLYKEHYGMVKYLITKNSGTEEDASDVFQDTVISLFELINKKSFQLTSSLSTLIYSIARNIWFKALRKKKERVDFKDFENFIEMDEEKEEKLEKESKMVKMEESIQEMGDPCKSILIQFYYLKKKMSEIAKSLNYTSADHAKAQKYKCLKRLRAIVIK